MSLLILAPMLAAFAQIPDFTPPNPLIAALMNNDTADVKRILDAGTKANEGVFLGATPLLLALMQGNTEAAQLLLDKGADPKVLDGAGSTTLMWAAGAENANVGMVKVLIGRGVDPGVVNKMGETALQWAMRRGYTPVTELLMQQGSSATNLVRQSVQRSINLLQKSGVEFVKVSGCVSCHHQSLPQMLNQVARERGFAVDQTIADKQRKAVVAMFQPVREQMAQGKPSLPDPSISVTYSLIGIAAEGHVQDEMTAAAAHLVSVQQREDGSFRSFAVRPPMESSEITATALSLRALQLYGMSADQPVERIQKAVNWLCSAQPRTNEDRAMRLLGMAWGKAPAEAMKRAARDLLGKQRQDGGWAQLENLESDAYATGQAMVALQAAHEIAPGSAAFGNAVAYLLRTQMADGSWLVRTRAFPFQPLKESGFPHGRDQWISASGTGWAAMALALSAPVPASQPEKQQLSQVF
ncbi:MAG: ankyrin repeat domain-containing protein [Bryobacteraceae bacterium]|nr:ankyrin repeat domain-containing protein [Bryobacteraceae bacterium]